jgi:hypothetical protein
MKGKLRSQKQSSSIKGKFRSLLCQDPRRGTGAQQVIIVEHFFIFIKKN